MWKAIIVIINNSKYLKIDIKEIWIFFLKKYNLKISILHGDSRVKKKRNIFWGRMIADKMGTF